MQLMLQDIDFPVNDVLQNGIFNVGVAYKYNHKHDYRFTKYGHNTSYMVIRVLKSI